MYLVTEFLFEQQLPICGQRARLHARVSLPGDARPQSRSVRWPVWQNAYGLRATDALLSGSTCAATWPELWPLRAARLSVVQTKVTIYCCGFFFVDRFIGQECKRLLGSVSPNVSIIDEYWYLTIRECKTSSL